MTCPVRARPPLRPLALLCAALALTLLSAPALAAPLSLEDALTRASGADPSVAAAAARLDASRSGVRQAGLRPNPTVGIDLENFAGSGPYSLLGEPEATLYYEQTFERGGKPRARTGLAQADLEVGRWRARVQRLDHLRDVQLAYAEAMAAEARVVVAEARYTSARTAQADIDRRVKAARDPLFAGARAETQTAEAEIALERARTNARDARFALAAFWRGGVDFDLDVTTFFAVGSGLDPAPSAEVADLALLAAEREVARARIDLERARGVSDPRIRAGVRYLGAGGDVALVVGGSIPLQRFDTNRDAVERAQAERTAAEVDLSSARTDRERRIARLQARMAAAASEAERIRTGVIPAALETVRLVRDGFARGGFQYLDVTEAERALAEARVRRIEVLEAFHTDKAALDRLTGRHERLVISAEPRQ